MVGCPAVSVVPAESGSVAAATGTGVWFKVIVIGWLSAVPETWL